MAVPGVRGWKSRWASRFRGADVVICFDCDKQGQEAARRVAADLVGVATSVRVLDLAPGRDDGYDLGDALCADVETVEDLRRAGDLLRQMAAKVEPERAPEPEPPGLVIEGVPLAAFTARPVEWLWEWRVPRGMLSLLYGMPFVGKSQLSLRIAAECGEPVLIATAEDTIETTVKPRAEAAGIADLGRVVIVQVRRHGAPDGLTLPEDAHRLEELVREHEARLLIIDPLNAYLSSAVNSFVDASMRRALAPLHRIAEGTGCAVLPLGHLNKNQAVTNPMLRAGGTIGLPGAVRSALLLATNPGDETDPERVLVHTDCNVGARQRPPWAYRIEPTPVELDGQRIETSRIEPAGDWDGDVEALLGPGVSASERGEVEEIMEWLRGELAGGPVAVQNIYAKTRKLGWADRTVRSAKERLKLISEKVGFGTDGIWSWRLPDADEAGGNE